MAYNRNTIKRNIENRFIPPSLATFIVTVNKTTTPMMVQIKKKT
jgi:hypothetical protein